VREFRSHDEPQCLAFDTSARTALGQFYDCHLHAPAYQHTIDQLGQLACATMVMSWLESLQLSGRYTVFNTPTYQSSFR
jgi:hypothetical protein